MFRRLITIPAWMVGSAVVVGGLLGTFVQWLIFPGLGSTDAAEISAVLGIVVLVLVVAIYIGILGFRGQLPGTSRGDSQAKEDGGESGLVSKAFAFLGVVLVASAVATIVAATVVTNYVPEIYQRQLHAGELDWIISVESEVLRESRDLRVKVPDGYDEDLNRRYPVLLVLDGEWQLDHTAGASATLGWLGLGEPMIVVGVVNGLLGRSVDFVPPEPATGRARADRFLEFLETEALPAIDGELRTNAIRVLVGYSLGGLFSVYTLVERPDLFAGILSLSPSLWRGDQAMVSNLESFLGSSPELDSYFYTSLGSREAHEMHDGFNALIGVLERGAPPGLQWRAELIEGADHGSNPVRSTPSALRGFWEFWTEAHPSSAKLETPGRSGTAS